MASRRGLVQQSNHLPMGEAVADYLRQDDADLLAACDVHCYRAGGPGGQKKNKTSSAVRLKHRPTGHTVVATESRSQHENRARAIRRLREAIAMNDRRPIAIDADAFEIPEAIRACIARDGRLRVGRRDARYLPAVAAMLDLLEAAEGRLSHVADCLGLRTGAVSAFLTRDPKLLAAANKIRRRHGHRPLKG